MLDVLIEPLQAGFMQRSPIIAILVGLLCAVVGSYLMVQRLLFVLALLFSPSYGVFTQRQSDTGQLPTLWRELKSLINIKNQGFEP